MDDGRPKEGIEASCDGGIDTEFKKCKFFADKIDYLSHVIRPGRIEIADHTTDAIRGLKDPSTITKLKSFLGLCNVFRRFVPNFARIAAPLNAKLRKDQPTKLGALRDTEKAAMTELQDQLISPPILTLPRQEGRFTIETDACDKQVGCVLLQEQTEGPLKPIGYWYRGLNDAERG